MNGAEGGTVPVTKCKLNNIRGIIKKHLVYTFRGMLYGVIDEGLLNSTERT
jgi:hypothetical protein